MDTPLAIPAVDFVNTHLRSCPKQITDVICSTKRSQDLLKRLVRATAKDFLTSVLLSHISKRIWASIQDNRSNLKRLHLDRYDSAMQFLDHQWSYPTHCPYKATVHIPDLVCVFLPQAQSSPENEWSIADATDAGVRAAIQHHQLESLVEIRDKDADPRRPFQDNDCIDWYLGARPDRPAIYCLSIGRQGFNIVYADTSGSCTSRDFWYEDNLKVLVSYVYSIYNPPAHHTLRDPSIRWESPNPCDPTSEPRWTVCIGGQEYSRGKIILGGDPAGRRTTIFEFHWTDNKFCIIIKDCYRLLIQRYDEGDLINHIHADGFVPGVVRFVSQEYVLDEGEWMTSGEGTDKRVRRRFLLADCGSRLTEAKSVNDLLKAVYDALEVSRTLALDRKVLHRDMSSNNILMYPKWGKLQHRRLMDNPPPLIGDVLSGSLRNGDDYQADCLLIDFDNAARLDRDDSPHELALRTGTPMYISRAVSAGRVWWAGNARYFPMPELSAEARKLYDDVYGPERYGQYREEGNTVHGGIPPSAKPKTHDFPKFYHKLEYDAESAFWSMLAAFLQVRPLNEADTDADDVLLDLWMSLENHTIKHYGQHKRFADHRETDFLVIHVDDYRELFHPCMQDLASMMHELAQQVAPSYALMDPCPLRPEHLHEAMQRIILNYLLAHRDNDIMLDPSNLRISTREQKEKPKLSELGDNTNTRKRSRQDENVETRPSKRFVPPIKEAPLPPQAVTGWSYKFGPRT